MGEDVGSWVLHTGGPKVLPGYGGDAQPGRQELAFMGLFWRVGICHRLQF
jgi:hypothetical protein